MIDAFLLYFAHFRGVTLLDILLMSLPQSGVGRGSFKLLGLAWVLSVEAFQEPRGYA